MTASAQSTECEVAQVIATRPEGLRHHAQQGQLESRCVIIAGRTGVDNTPLAHLVAQVNTYARYEGKTRRIRIDIPQPLEKMNVGAGVDGETRGPHSWTKTTGYWHCPGFGNNRRRRCVQVIVNMVCIQRIVAAAQAIKRSVIESAEAIKAAVLSEDFIRLCGDLDITFCGSVGGVPYLSREQPLKMF